MEVGCVVEDTKSEVGLRGTADHRGEAAGSETRGPWANGRGNGVGDKEIRVGCYGGEVVKINGGGEVG